jgi:hypothetical protein
MQGKDKKKMDIYNIWLLHILKIQKIILKPSILCLCFYFFNQTHFYPRSLVFPGIITKCYYHKTPKCKTAFIGDMVKFSFAVAHRNKTGTTAFSDS